MNGYVKSFLHRGLIFGGFGPIVIGIIYFILSHTLTDFSISGSEVFLAILSTYLLAFVHAGASIFNQMDEMPLALSTLLHFGTLYIAYTVCYLLNAWIPFELTVFLIYTSIFVIGYFAVWIAVYASVRAASRRFNARLNEK